MTTSNEKISTETQAQPQPLSQPESQTVEPSMSSDSERVRQYKTAIAVLLAFILGMSVGMAATPANDWDYRHEFNSGHFGDYRNNIFPQRNYDPYVYPAQPNVQPNVQPWGVPQDSWQSSGGDSGLAQRFANPDNDPQLRNKLPK